jgi:methionyl-tRNA formyltransferase
MTKQKVITISRYEHFLRGVTSEHNVQHVSISDGESDDRIFDIEPDFILCFGTDKILSEQVLNSFRCYKLHGSMLPFTRGPSPEVWRWLKDEPHGVSLIRMNNGIDSGPIVGQLAIEKPDKRTLRTSNIQTVQRCVRLLRRHFSSLLNNDAEEFPQSHEGTYYSFEDQKVFADLLRTHEHAPLRQLINEVSQRLRT